jgi:hypothetical protein
MWTEGFNGRFYELEKKHCLFGWIQYSESKANPIAYLSNKQTKRLEDLGSLLPHLKLPKTFFNFPESS